MIKKYSRNQHTIVCDRCGIEGPIASTATKAILAADQKGWRVEHRKTEHGYVSRHICPECYAELMRD